MNISRGRNKPHHSRNLFAYMSGYHRWRVFNGSRSRKAFERFQPENRGKKQWYRFENSADEGTTHIYIYDEIGYWGNTADQFVEELKACNTTQITLHVNSPGGDVFDGMAMMNALRNHSATVRAEVDGVAASAASFIIQGADHVAMMPGSQLMIHDASGLIYGNAEELRKLAEELERCSDSIAGIYADRAGGTVSEWRDRMKETTWYSDQEAVDAGLADEVISAGKRKGKPCDVAPIILDVDNVDWALPDVHLLIDEARDRILAPFDVDPEQITTAVSMAAENRPAEPPSVEYVPVVARIAQAVKEGLEV